MNTALSVSRVATVIAFAAIGCSSPADEETSESTSALTLESGEVCVITAPGGAQGLGHTGWMYQTAHNRYVVGSTENPAGSATIPKLEDIGYWERAGVTREGARRILAARRADIEPYTAMACREVKSPNLPAAAAERKETKAGGYGVIGNNCADHTWNILHAYGAPMGSLQLHPTPNGWYGRLKSAHGYVEEDL